jgi:hypothetical protein
MSPGFVVWWSMEYEPRKDETRGHQALLPLSLAAAAVERGSSIRILFSVATSLTGTSFTGSTITLILLVLTSIISPT